jgi:hypothetical protein
MNRDELLLNTLAGVRTGAAKGMPAPTIKVGATKLWVPLAFTVVLVQGATQTPLPGFCWDDGTNILGVAPGAAAAVSVSTTTRMTWVRGLKNQPTAGAGLTQNIAPLPDLVLEAGWRVSTLTAGIGANTDYAAATLTYAELTI